MPTEITTHKSPKRSQTTGREKRTSTAPNTELLRAARSVLASSVGESTSDADWITRADELAVLTLAVQETANSGETSVVDRNGTPLRRELLDRLEAEVIKRDVDGPSDALRLHDLMLALSRVRLALELEPDADDEARTDLTQPTGLQLISEIAHDLRSPLTSILTLAEALRRGRSGPVNEVQRRQLGIIYSAALALSGTASDFLELAHGGDRLAQKEPTPFSIEEVFDSVRDIVCPMAEEKGLDLKVKTKVADRRVGYPVALRRVLLNLTANALKFTDEGVVEMAARRAGPLHVEFSVRDTGKGIEPGSERTLFQTFRRVPGDRGFYFSGTGLGLTICRRLVRAMDSELQFESWPGEGTRFFFQVKLPRPDLLA